MFHLSILDRKCLSVKLYFHSYYEKNKLNTLPQNKTLTRSSDINHNNLSTNKTSANTHYKNNREKKKIDGLNLYPNVCNLSIHILSMKMKEQIFLIQILWLEYDLVGSKYLSFVSWSIKRHTKIWYYTNQKLQSRIKLSVSLFN